MYYWRRREHWEEKETEIAMAFIQSHHPCSARLLSTTCPVPTRRWHGFSSLLPFFPQGCTNNNCTLATQYSAQHHSLQQHWDCSIFSWITRQKEVSGQVPPLGQLRTLLLWRPHQPLHSIHTSPRSWCFAKELIHGRSTEQAFQRLSKNDDHYLSSFKVLINRWFFPSYRTLAYRKLLELTLISISDPENSASTCNL